MSSEQHSPKPGRIGGHRWLQAKPNSFAVYNAGYSPSGHRLWMGDRPWTVMGPKIFETFPTHAEAIHYAFARVGK